MKSPPELGEHLRAQPISIACGRGARIRRPVMLDRQHVAIGVVGIDDGEVELEPTTADLMTDRPAALDERTRAGRSYAEVLNVVRNQIDRMLAEGERLAFVTRWEIRG